MPLSTGLSQLLAAATAPPEPGRRYPRYANAPQGLDIPGEVLPPSALPNPLGLKHRDPIELEQIRPLLDTQNGPQWRWRL